MAANSYPAAMLDRCGRAAYAGIVGENVEKRFPWEKLGTVAKGPYIIAAAAILDEAKVISAPPTTAGFFDD
jgi:hypothetical protein